MKDENKYINISKASSSSLVERVGASTTLNSFVPIKDVAEAKGLKSTRSLRLEINKPESKYISREIKVNGGTSYEILFSSLEPELQDKLRKCETKSTALVPLNYQPPIITDKARLTANHRINIVKSALKYRKKYKTQKEADFEKEHIILDEESAITIVGNTKLRDYWRVTVKDDNSIFYITRDFFSLIGQQSVRANFTPAPTYCYIKDVTKEYITQYPALEHAYIIQEVVGKRQ